MKRAQASVDFLFTYGWALMAVLIVLIAITYFGISRPQQFVAQQCVADDAFNCFEFGADSDSLDVILQSKVGMPLNITAVAVLQAFETECIFTAPDVPEDGNRLPRNGTFSLVFGCANGTTLISGSTVRLDFLLSYQVDLAGYFPKTSHVSVVFVPR